MRTVQSEERSTGNMQTRAYNCRVVTMTILIKASDTNLSCLK